MKLDKSKKYEFCGEVCSHHDDLHWVGDSWVWTTGEFQFFADYGHVTEVREPLVFEGEVTFDGKGCIGDGAGVGCWWTAISCEQRKGKTFKVTWTEVVK